MARRIVGKASCKPYIAGTDGNEAPAQSFQAPFTAAAGEEAANRGGRAQHAADRPPGHHHDDDQGDQRGEGRHQADFDLVAQPVDDDRTRPVGKPGRAQGDDENQREIEKQANHVREIPFY